MSAYPAVTIIPLVSLERKALHGGDKGTGPYVTFLIKGQSLCRVSI